MVENLPSKKEQRELIDTIEKQEKLQEGDTWYVISSTWYKDWSEYVGYKANEPAYGPEPPEKPDAFNDWEMINGNEDVFPGIIKNKELMESSGVLKTPLIDGYDYKLITKDAWDNFATWYGYDYSLPRMVISRGIHRSLLVDLYPVVFQLYYWKNTEENPQALMKEGEPLKVSFSSTTKLQAVECEIRDKVKDYQLFTCQTMQEEMDSTMIRLCYKRFESNPWKPLDLSNNAIATLELSSLGVEDNEDGLPFLLIEEKHKEHTDKFMSTVEANKWRYEVKVGDWIDGKDTEEKWYECVVLDLAPEKIKIHYRGWTSKWDTWMDRNSDKIAPLYTEVPRWRDFRVNDTIELGTKGSEFSELRSWNKGKIMQIDKEKKQVLIREDGLPLEDAKWVDILSESICQVGTHTKASKVNGYISSSSTPSYSSFGRSNTRGRPSIEGAVGLQNLGNTCFMNSMIQCLSNSEVLTNYFLSGRYLNEINHDNPLGMGGRVAEAYADLLNDMWSGNYTVVVPSRLKHTIGQYCPQFAGYQQQDSQELMSFLLDGLHEDLNRIKNKPFTEKVESNGRDDLTVAIESWQQYQRRNQSVIVDNCIAQLRSHVTCPECGNQSITFDPYMSLSVPLPVVNTRNIQLQLFFANGDVPTKFSVEVDKEGTVLDLKKSLSDLCKIPSSHLILLDVFSHRVSRVFNDNANLREIRLSQLDVYEVEEPFALHVISSSNLLGNTPKYSSYTSIYEDDPLDESNSAEKKMRLISVLHQAPSLSSGDSPEGSLPKHRRVELFGTPLLLSIPIDATNNDIHRKMWLVVRRLLKPNNTTFSADEPPYKIAVTNPAGSIIHLDELPHDNEVFQPPQPSSTCFTFTLVWSAAGYQDGYHEPEAEKVNMHQSMSKMQVTPGDNSISLHSCIMKFTEREQLGENDTWYCPKCKEHRRAFKKIDLWSVPNVLIIHLKRFRYAQSSFFMHRDKIDSLVKFPIEGLDMSKYIISPEENQGAMYDLFAVSEHSGGLGGGHYTAIAQNFRNGQWYNYSDSYTSTTTPESSISSQAYVLFYRRRSQPSSAL